jgi:hypothetical protein
MRTRPTTKRRHGCGSTRHAPTARDQGESTFTWILGGLLARIPGARAAALVDSEGETADYAGHIDPFAVRVAAAHWRIVLEEVGRQRSLLAVRWVVVRAERASFLVVALPDGYALLVLLTRGAGFGGWHRAIDACVRSLAREAGWEHPPSIGGGRISWFPVDVLCARGRRPRGVRVAGRTLSLDVLGAVVDPSSARGRSERRDRAWRVRLETGVETTLMCEPGGTWYSDESLGPEAPIDRRRDGRARSPPSQRDPPRKAGPVSGSRKSR